MKSPQATISIYQEVFEKYPSIAKNIVSLFSKEYTIGLVNDQPVPASDMELNRIKLEQNGIFLDFYSYAVNPDKLTGIIIQQRD